LIFEGRIRRNERKILISRKKSMDLCFMIMIMRTKKGLKKTSLQYFMARKTTMLNYNYFFVEQYVAITCIEDGKDWILFATTYFK
jgi:hypothetical protein